MGNLFGPADETVPDVYTASPDPSSYDASLLNTLGPWLMHGGDVLTASWTSAVKSSGGAGFDVYLKEILSAPHTFAGSFGSSLTWTAAAGGLSVHVTVPHDGTYFVALLDGGNGVHGGGGIGTLFNFSVDTSGLPPTAFCAGGTTRKDSTTDLVILGTTAINGIGIAIGGVWGELLSLLANAIGAHVLSTSTLCASLPPPMPVITNADYLALTGAAGVPTTDQLSKFWQAVQAAVWPYYCECTPGTGGTPPPAPTAPSITIQLPPSIVCDDADLCSVLNVINQKLDFLSLQLQYARRDVTLIQRQKVPFAYVLGAFHSGLSGHGELTVSDILGLSVQFSTIPAQMIPRGADPLTFDRLGWINLGTAAGWQRAVECRHNPQLILDIDGDVTTVGYDLADGVVCNVQELVREP